MENIEKPNSPKNKFEEIPEITPSRLPEMEQFITGVYERNPKAKELADRIATFLNDKTFDQGVLAKKIDLWNESEKIGKGFKGQFSEIQTITGKHGKLKVIHYMESDSIRFVYSSQ